MEEHSRRADALDARSVRVSVVGPPWWRISARKELVVLEDPFMLIFFKGGR